jgi:hypothetical protein
MRLESAERRWVSLAVVVWSGVVLTCCLRALLAPHTKSIYPILALGARHWVAGEDLYCELAPGLDRFRYSPLIGALLVPFSLLPDGVGAALWRLLNAGVYLAALSWWVRALLPSSLTSAQRAMLFLLVVPLSIGSLNNGQSNALLVGLLLAGSAAVRADRWNLGAGCVAGACLLKVYPIALALLLGLLFPRRFAGRFVLALALGLLLPFGLQQANYVVDQYGSWLAHFETYDRQCLIVELWYRDLRLYLYGWSGPLSPRTYTMIQMLSGALIALICVGVQRAGWRREQLLILVLGLTCFWMTVLGPATESCTYILLAPSLAWALLDAWRTRRRDPGVLFLLVSFSLFLACLIAVWFPGARAFHALGMQPLAGLLFLASFQPLWSAIAQPWLRYRPEALASDPRWHFDLVSRLAKTR